MRFTQFRGGFHCSLQNFNYFCLQNVPSFRATICTCWLSCQCSMQCTIRNKFVKLRKFLKVENFSATTIDQAPVQTKNMIEKYYTVFWFLQMIVPVGLLFCGKCQTEPNDWSISEMNKFSLKTQWLRNFGGKLVLLLALKTKIYRNFANWQQFLLNFLKFSILLTNQKFE